MQSSGEARVTKAPWCFPCNMLNGSFLLQGLGHRLRVVAISDLKEELRKFAAAEKRWKSQVSWS